MKTLVGDIYFLDSEKIYAVILIAYNSFQEWAEDNDVALEELSRLYNPGNDMIAMH